jgi:hypothetical protein
LQPWGRIQGALRLKSRSNAGQEITLSDPRKPDSSQIVSLSSGAYATRTDEQGNFAFDQAPPGRFILCLSEGLGQSASHQTSVLIQPGATTLVQIGGAGDLVSGRLVLSSPGQTLDWSKQLWDPILQTRLPYAPGLSLPARTEWLRQYEQTEEGRARIRDWCSYPLEVQPDGTFAVEDVPPGDYELSGQLLDATGDLSAGVQGHIIGSFRQDVTVPQPADAASSEKTDLGIVPVQTRKP